jgi:hypothetical protein
MLRGPGGCTDQHSAVHTHHLLFPTPTQASPDHDAFWASLAALPPSAPLPVDLPARFYYEAASYIRGAQYADRIREWAAHVPAEKCVGRCLGG